MTASNLTFTNVVNATYLFETYDASRAKISDISVNNVSTSSQSVVLFKKSSNLELNSIKIENISQLILKIDRSHFKLLNNLTIKNTK